MIAARQLEQPRPSQLEFTPAEQAWWANQILVGQQLFNRHIADIGITPVHLTPNFNGREKILAYIPEMQAVVATFVYVTTAIKSARRYTNQPTRRTTSPHLQRLGVATIAPFMPIFAGIEEQAHAHFSQHIEPTLDPQEISRTGLYDGSDTAEQYAFEQLGSIIMREPDLKVFPLLEFKQPVEEKI